MQDQNLELFVDGQHQYTPSDSLNAADYYVEELARF